MCAVLASSGVVAAQASAQAIAVEQACVVNASTGVGTLTVRGSGFTAGDYIELQADYDANFGTGIADSGGAFETSFAGPALPTTRPDVASIGLLATDITTAAMATTSVSVANLAASVSPTKVKAGKKATYSFSGFTGDAEIYGHYLRNHKLIKTLRFGKASGACGVLRTRTSFDPAHYRYGQYVLQVDESRQYSPQSQPSAVTAVDISRP